MSAISLSTTSTSTQRVTESSPERSQSMVRGGFFFDPRTKLAFLLTANVLMFIHAAPAVQACAAVFFCLPLMLGGKMKTAVRMLCVYAALLGAEYCSIMFSQQVPWLHVIGMSAAGIAMLMPCLIAGMAAFCTTRPSDFVCALRRLHVPHALIIPVIVLMRFFPTIRHDYRQIRHSLRLRGIAEHSGAMLLRPLQSLEYILIPLLMNAVRVAQDLTVAALTKGLGVSGRTTSMVQLRMRASDWVSIIVSILLIIAGIFV